MQGPPLPGLATAHAWLQEAVLRIIHAYVVHRVLILQHQYMFVRFSTVRATWYGPSQRFSLVVPLSKQLYAKQVKLDFPMCPRVPPQPADLEYPRCAAKYAAESCSAVRPLGFPFHCCARPRDVRSTIRTSGISCTISCSNSSSVWSSRVPVDFLLLSAAERFVPSRKLDVRPMPFVSAFWYHWHRPSWSASVALQQALMTILTEAAQALVFFHVIDLPNTHWFTCIVSGLWHDARAACVLQPSSASPSVRKNTSSLLSASHPHGIIAATSLSLCIISGEGARKSLCFLLVKPRIKTDCDGHDCKCTDGPSSAARHGLKTSLLQLELNFRLIHTLRLWWLHLISMPKSTLLLVPAPTPSPHMHSASYHNPMSFFIGLLWTSANRSHLQKNIRMICMTPYLMS